jgi:hypothetical protein
MQPDEVFLVVAISQSVAPINILKRDKALLAISLDELSPGFTLSEKEKRRCFVPSAGGLNRRYNFYSLV